MMRAALLSTLLLLGLGSARCLAEPLPRTTKESWDAAFLENAKAGFVRTVVEDVERDGNRLLRTTTELNLTLKRFRDTIQLRSSSGTEETADGKVLGVSMMQYLGKQQQLVLKGTVEGDRLNVVVDQGQNRLERKIPWNDNVVGLYRQERLFAERKVKPGDQFSYQTFEPTINRVITIQASVKDYEEVDVVRPPQAGDRRGAIVREKQRLLRVDAVPEKITVGDNSLQVPALVLWLNADLQPVRSQMDLPGLGKLTLYRATKEQATGTVGVAAAVTDIGIGQLIRLSRPISNPYGTSSAVYRLRIRGDKEPKTAFATDDRQKIMVLPDGRIEMTVQTLRQPRKVDKPGEVGEEYLQSCYFVNCNDARVKELAQRAVGRETDPWEKALLVEKWVHNNMRSRNFTEAFATADQVAKTLEGDCTEHAMLTAAMCRAEAIPSRVAVGLVYVGGTQGPAMGFHMWTEVWVRGQWMPLDATLGLGFVGATHLKVADHSWHDTQSLAPLLPLMLRVVGKLDIEVVKTASGG